MPEGWKYALAIPKRLLALVHKIAKREGVGDLLAEGTRVMAQRLGQGSERFAMNVKGLELPAYDSRAAKITGLAFATANRGGDHITGYVQGPDLSCQSIPGHRRK